MITDYTAMLSMGKAQVMLNDGTFVERDMVYGDHITLAIKGHMHEFQFWRVSLDREDGNTWKAQSSVDIGDGFGHKHAIRLLINRFLQVFPSSDATVRMWHLFEFLRKPSSLYQAESIRRMISTRFSKAQRKPFGRPDHALYNDKRFTKRVHRFSDRQRDFFRLRSPRNAKLLALVSEMVRAYSNYCSNFNNGSSDGMSQWGAGWVLRFSDMKVVGYDSNGQARKVIDLAPFNTNSESIVALHGIRNVFCADIVEQTEDTAMLRVYGKNSKPKGYICVGKKDNYCQSKDRWVIRLSPKRYTADDIGGTRGEAIARMLARG